MKYTFGKVLMIVAAFIVVGIVATAAQIKISDSSGIQNVGDVTGVGQLNFTAKTGDSSAIYAQGANGLITLKAYSATSRPSIKFIDTNGVSMADIQCHNMSGAVEHAHCKWYTWNGTDLDGRFAITFGTPQATVDFIRSTINMNYNPIYGVQNISISPSSATAKALKINLGTLSTEYGLWLYSNIGATANQPLVYLDADNTAFDQRVMFINNDGTQNAIYIDSEAPAQDVMVLDKVSTGTGYGLTITDNAASSVINLLRGKTASSAENLFYRDYNPGNTSSPIMKIFNDNALDDQGALLVETDGVGVTATIDQDGNQIAFVVDSEGTSYQAVDIYGKYAVNIQQDLSSGYGLKVTRALGEAGSFPLVKILDDHSSNTQPALTVDQDGTGAAATGINIDCDGGAAINSTDGHVVIADGNLTLKEQKIAGYACFDANGKLYAKNAACI